MPVPKRGISEEGGNHEEKPSTTQPTGKTRAYWRLALKGAGQTTEDTGAVCRSDWISTEAIADREKNPTAVNTPGRRRIRPLAPRQNLPGRRYWRETYRTHVPGHGGFAVYEEDGATETKFNAYHVVKVNISRDEEILGEEVDCVLNRDLAIACALNSLS
jgi:hypothetical protein